ncbi:hypothetical protein DFH06DRAFT_1308168 [Mycena polygramma]|nr:hypothetical protein DFH06DRAFT_1308168 [Mycena polygramma]
MKVKTKQVIYQIHKNRKSYKKFVVVSLQEYAPTTPTLATPTSKCGSPASSGSSPGAGAGRSGAHVGLCGDAGGGDKAEEDAGGGANIPGAGIAINTATRTRGCSKRPTPLVIVFAPAPAAAFVFAPELEVGTLDNTVLELLAGVPKAEGGARSEGGAFVGEEGERADEEEGREEGGMYDAAKGCEKGKGCQRAASEIGGRGKERNRSNGTQGTGGGWRSTLRTMEADWGTKGENDARGESRTQTRKEGKVMEQGTEVKPERRGRGVKRMRMRRGREEGDEEAERGGMRRRRRSEAAEGKAAEKGDTVWDARCTGTRREGRGQGKMKRKGKGRAAKDGAGGKMRGEKMRERDGMEGDSTTQGMRSQCRARKKGVGRYERECNGRGDKEEERVIGNGVEEGNGRAAQEWERKAKGEKGGRTVRGEGGEAKGLSGGSGGVGEGREGERGLECRFDREKEKGRRGREKERREVRVERANGRDDTKSNEEGAREWYMVRYNEGKGGSRRGTDRVKEGWRKIQQRVDATQVERGMKREWKKGGMDARMKGGAGGRYGRTTVTSSRDKSYKCSRE